MREPYSDSVQQSTPRSPWGRELAWLAQGRPLLEVLGSVCGQDSAGRVLQAQWLAYLSTLPTRHSRRMELEHFLRTFERAARHGSQWRAIGSAAYVGRRHELGRREVDVLDPETGEMRREPSSDLKRRHCPARRAGGLAARQQRSPRQLDRYRQHLRSAGVIGSAQPPADAPDAVRSRGGDGRWAYAQHWLRWPPTPEMLRRWRGPYATTAKRRPSTPPAPASAARPPRKDELDCWGLLAEHDRETHD